MFVPLLLVLIGIASLLNALGVYVVNWEIVWPIVLIALGAFMAFRRDGHSRWDCKGCKDCSVSGICKGCSDCKHCDTHK